ncbi:SDR family oxidoreductase [Pseudomonas sp. CDFA 602]|uniref:UDP-glucose 4-epimerase family protein n=1 Tax=Pseudomonas californiensis TaxID=2829823 RepID=UPI001E37B547|nr:SDR family oxidoreductase [Pseudomonas californiensis]MCD5996900.1 SDR family oxidoreductase [Pseudomonas californiensis]MCD6002446.1 SDR family oxidoreductase [Pseudomonas californiensis]
MGDKIALVAITGATGFVGSALVRHLIDRTAMDVRVAVRTPYSSSHERVEVVNGASLAPDHRWSSFVEGVDVLIHCAARVHVLNDSVTRPEIEYFRTNVAATLNLAEQAAAAGVKRFIFMSSIKVNGESTPLGKPFKADDECDPVDPYGASKHKAEQGLRELGARTGMEVVIIRPVLVYGPGVKANFLNMMRWLDKGLPLPLGAVANRRSLVALGNLIDLVTCCIRHPAACGQTFLVSDGHDLSTTQLLKEISTALGRPARLLPVPAWLLRKVATVIGKKDFSERLCGSLQVDITKTCTMLDWVPPVRLEDAMKETARYYLEHAHA